MILVFAWGSKIVPLDRKLEHYVGWLDVMVQMLVMRN